ncbi:Uncharacterised protein [Achromobacter sp. 2789STDY5608615]|nr:Uncharacterised protein [Achromobacter sp. 2789STDY5608615]
MKLKLCGVIMPACGAYRPPARPTTAADTMKATAFTSKGLMPMDSLAVSLSLTARIAAPQLPRASRA